MQDKEIAKVTCSRNVFDGYGKGDNMFDSLVIGVTKNRFHNKHNCIQGDGRKYTNYLENYTYPCVWQKSVICSEIETHAALRRKAQQPFLNWREIYPISSVME